MSSRLRATKVRSIVIKSDEIYFSSGLVQRITLQYGVELVRYRSVRKTLTPRHLTNASTPLCKIT